MDCLVEPNRPLLHFYIVKLANLNLHFVGRISTIGQMGGFPLHFLISQMQNKLGELVVWLWMYTPWFHMFSSSCVLLFYIQDPVFWVL